MKRFLYITIFFTFVLYSLCGIEEVNALEERKPGDQIWGQCANITRTIITIPITINNACINLVEAADCKVNVSLSVSSQKVFEKTLDTGAPVICGTYNINQGPLQAACNVCIVFRSNPNVQNSQCVSVEPTCKIPPFNQVVNLDPYDAGCLQSDQIAAIQNCRNSVCPASCSGHGTCNAGKCDCDLNYFGSDCSVSSNLFEKCIQVNQLTGNICTRLVFENCGIKLQILVELGAVEVPIKEISYPLRSYGTPFLQDFCTALPGSDCNLCYKWDSLNLSPNSATGCGSLSLVCGGNTYSTYQLGCFTDNAVVPACFGSCPNDCSGHGNCSRATCICDQPYSGDDCSQRLPQCPTPCNHGVCQNGACSCDNKWTGSDCNAPVTDSLVAPFNAAYVVIPFVLLVAGAAIGVGIWYVKKKRDAGPKFSQFELLKEDDEAFKLTSIEESSN